MKNIFLTGEITVGKSTVIQKTLSLLPPSVCGGFRTVSDFPITAGAILDVFIEQACKKTPHDKKHCVGSRLGNGRFLAYPDVFDTVGTTYLLNSSAEAKLILMDELGVMESNAEVFCASVLNLLNGSTPILGVIKPKNTAFLETIRNHERSQIIEVTMNNRDALPAQIAGILDKYI